MCIYMSNKCYVTSTYTTIILPQHLILHKHLFILKHLTGFINTLNQNKLKFPALSCKLNQNS